MILMFQIITMALLVAPAVAFAQADAPPPVAPPSPAASAEAVSAEPAAPSAAAPSLEPALAPAPAQGNADDTRARLDALAAEVRNLKLEIAAPATEIRSHAGMGPAASKVYFSPRGLAIGGYGEVTYENYVDQPNKKDKSDLLRAIVYTGYRFNDRIVFNAELEFEHSHTGKKGAVEVEFAYLDFILGRHATARVGNVLVPIGFVNEMHEPATFHGVLRPDVERNLIPTTWNENGLGVYGQAGILRYKAYLMNGLQAFSDQKCVTDANKVSVCDRGNRGFTSGSWIREGRQRGSEAVTEDFAGVVNLTVTPVDSLLVGATAYAGRSGHGTKIDGYEVKGSVRLFEVHAGFRHAGLELRALGALGLLGGSDWISGKQGQVVGSRVMGGYVEAAYDVLRLILPGSEQALLPFVRFEALDLHAKVPDGATVNPALSTTNLTAGLSYRPVASVVLKADYQRRRSGASMGSVLDQVNVGVGYAF
jgi:hypothetical protein